MRNVTFQKRHFELMADTLKTTHNELATSSSQFDRESSIAVISVAYAFADRLAATNTKFDRKRFLLACGVEFPK